jgi:hypothetical protein
MTVSASYPGYVGCMAVRTQVRCSLGSLVPETLFLVSRRRSAVADLRVVTIDYGLLDSHYIVLHKKFQHSPFGNLAVRTV